MCGLAEARGFDQGGHIPALPCLSWQSNCRRAGHSGAERNAEFFEESAGHGSAGGHEWVFMTLPKALCQNIVNPGALNSTALHKKKTLLSSLCGLCS